MDGLIRTAWRAFWIGLGASAVLIGQSVIAPQGGSAGVPGDPSLAPMLAPAAPLAPAAARARQKSADPLSVRCESIGLGLRCS